MAASYMHPAYNASSEYYAGDVLKPVDGQGHTLVMAVRKKDPRYRPTFVKEWRRHRGLNQERLAERVGVSQETISRLERGKLPYSQPLLEALAEALRCEPADLITRDPSKEDYLWAIWAQIPHAERPQAVRILQTFKKTGTDG